MKHDVFISHSSKNYDIATKVCEELEKNNIKVWIAPRDLTPGKSYASEIVDGISNTSIVLLLFTEESYNSDPVRREIERAIDKKKTIINFRLQDLPLDSEWQYLISSVHWLDASTVSFDFAIKSLINFISLELDSTRKSKNNILKINTVEDRQNIKENIKDKEIDIFISKKSSDYKIAKEIFDMLTANGLNVFLSEDSLPKLGNADYMEEIDNALESCNHLIVVGSSIDNINSSWVKGEWRAFINEKRAGRKTGNVLTIVDGISISQLPISLRYYEVINYDNSSLGSILSYFQ